MFPTTSLFLCLYFLCLFVDVEVSHQPTKVEHQPTEVSYNPTEIRHQPTKAEHHRHSSYSVIYEHLAELNFYFWNIKRNFESFYRFLYFTIPLLGFSKTNNYHRLNLLYLYLNQSKI
jgi:hypothetical protein